MLAKMAVNVETQFEFIRM